MAGWHHRLDGHECEQAPGVGDGQGSLACCGPWGHKESDMTEWLNWTVWCTLSGVYVFYKWLCFVYFIVLYGIVQYLCFKPRMSATKQKQRGCGWYRLLLMTLQLYHLPPLLPPPVGNSSCLFTRCHPLHAGCCTVLLHFSRYYPVRFSFPGGSDGKESACNAGDLASVRRSGRFPAEGNGYPL